MTRQMFAAAVAVAMIATGLTGSAQGIGTVSAEKSDAILIDFSSSHCAPCRAMQSILHQLERDGVAVRHVDVGAEPQLASRYGIRQTPTFVIVSGGQEITRLVGTQSAAQLRTALAIDPTGPLVRTNATGRSRSGIEAPQTRLAPIDSSGPSPVAILTSAPAAPSTGEAMPSMSVADAIQRAQAATVRLRVHDGHGYGAGTGTIIDTHGDEALVLTCGHLFRDNEGKGKVEVDLFVGGETRTVAGQVIDYDADTRDIALVSIRPGVAIEPVQLIGAGESVQNGQTAFSYGCDRGADPSRRDTRLTGINKYNQHLGASNLEIAGAPIDGRSGGGLFDQAGRLIGVCNAADYQSDVGIYAGPGAIQWQLDRVQLAHLYQRSGSGPPSVSAPQAQLASLPPQGTTEPAAGQEVIVIVRDPSDPHATPRVMTLQEPTPEVMQMLERHAR